MLSFTACPKSDTYLGTFRDAMYDQITDQYPLNYCNLSPDPVRHFLQSSDFSYDDLRLILDTAKLQKAKAAKGLWKVEPQSGRLLSMIFEKQSLRTRVSFEVAISELGGHAVFLTQSDIDMGKRESIADTARVLSNWSAVIVARLKRHSDLIELSRWSSVPVINALTDLEHPCQALADVLTIEENFGSAKLKIAWIGDGNNVANSFALTAAKLGHSVMLCTPPGYEAESHVYSEPGVESCYSPVEAAKDADVIYADVWISMGQEDEKTERAHRFRKFQVNKELMERANDRAIFLHCLPAIRGQEVTSEVIDGSQSAVFRQSDNRLHSQRALLSLILEGALV